jgi:ferredoxin
MKVSVDKETCSGCGVCVDICPDVFEMEDEVARAKVNDVPPEFKDAVKESAEACPVEAIIVEE